MDISKKPVLGFFYLISFIRTIFKNFRHKGNLYLAAFVLNISTLYKALFQAVLFVFKPLKYLETITLK